MAEIYAESDGHEEKECRENCINQDITALAFMIGDSSSIFGSHNLS
jgi:hypothetical protein